MARAKKTSVSTEEKEEKNDLRSRILKNSKLEETSMLLDSVIFSEKEMSPTPVPLLNVALSGLCDGGLLPGTLMIAGPSKHVKTLFGLLAVKSFLEKNPDGVILFYDSEFGTNKKYFKIFGIDETRIVHAPVAVVEDLTHDILNQVDAIKKGEPVMILIDSIGNLASAKELADATAGNEKVDMTRAKKVKALFRMITTKLILKGIPMIIINHTYKTQEIYSKDVTGGGTGPIYNSNDIWIIGRQQDKDGKELEGFNFVINIEKSRTIKEKSKFPITVSFESGIQKWSGLLDLAVEAGIIEKPNDRTYQYGDWSNYKEKKYDRKDIEYNSAFWTDLLAKTELKKYIENKYQLSDSFIIKEDDGETIEQFLETN